MQVKQKHKCLYVGLPKNIPSAAEEPRPLSLMVADVATDNRSQPDCDITSAPHHLSVLSAYIWCMYHFNMKRGFIHTWNFESSIINHALQWQWGEFSLNWSLICGVLNGGDESQWARSSNRLMSVSSRNLYQAHSDARWASCWGKTQHLGLRWQMMAVFVSCRGFLHFQQRYFCLSRSDLFKTKLSWSHTLMTGWKWDSTSRPAKCPRLEFSHVAHARLLCFPSELSRAVINEGSCFQNLLCNQNRLEGFFCILRIWATLWGEFLGAVYTISSDLQFYWCTWAVMCQSAPGVYVFRKPLVFHRIKGDVVSLLVVIAVMFSECLYQSLQMM